MSCSPSLSGNNYSYALTLMENMGILYPEAHMFFNQVITRHDPDVVGYIMIQISLKVGLKIWGNKGKN